MAMITRALRRETREVRRRSWAPRPVLSFLLGAFLLLGPVAISWVIVRFVEGIFYHPAGFVGLGLWIVQAIAVSATITILIHRLAERLSP